MPSEPVFDFNAMTPEEHQELAQELGHADTCESGAALSPAVRAELDRRIDAYRRNPDAGEPWEVVEQEVLRYLDEQERASAA